MDLHTDPMIGMTKDGTCHETQYLHVPYGESVITCVPGKYWRGLRDICTAGGGYELVMSRTKCGGKKG